MSKKISQLPSSQTPTSGDIVPLANSVGVTVGAKLRHLKNLFDNDAGMNDRRGISGNLAVSGALSVSGALKVSGSTNLGRNSTDVTLITGPLRQSGNSTVSGSLTVTGDISASGNSILLGRSSSIVDIRGTTSAIGSFSSQGDARVIGNFGVSNNFLLSGAGVLGTTGQSAIQHTIYGYTIFDQTGFFKSGIVVDGNITGENLQIAGATELRGLTYTFNDTTIGSSASHILTIPSTLIANAASRFDAGIEARGNINVWGNFITSGTNTLGNDYTDKTDVTGPLSSRAYFMAWSGADISGNINSSGKIACLGSGIFATGVSVNGRMTVSGSSWLGNAIDKPTHINGTGYVSGAMTVIRDLGVSGDIHCAGRVFSSQVKQGFFDPQIKVGIKNGVYFDSGVGVNKIKFLFKRTNNGVASDAGTVLWNSGDFQANDVIYISGVKDTPIPGVSDADQDKLNWYNGFYNVDSLFSDSLEVGMFLKPTGLPMSPPAVAGGSHAARSGAVPYILCHYRSGWLNGISGVIPIQGMGNIDDLNGSSDPGTWYFHHRVIFKEDFSSSDYMTLLSCNQGSGQNTIEGSVTARLKAVNVSYMDKNLPSERTIYAGMAAGTGNVAHNLNNYDIGEYFGGMPTRVWVRFEELG